MPRLLTAGAHTWRLGPSFTYDWLVESQALDIHWSFSTASGGGHVWESRLLTISEIEQSVTPGGGLASAQTVTITVAEETTGQSLWATYNATGRMQGADLTVSLLPQGETYGNKIPFFTGKIDAVSWRAGTESGEGIGTVIAVDDTLHKDIQVPNKLLTPDLYPNLPDQWRGAIVPMLYGHSLTLPVAPLLLVDEASLTYLVADQPLGLMGTNHAVAVAEGTRFLSLAGAATSSAFDATMILSRPVTENRYAIGGLVQAVSRQLNVVNPGSINDGNTGTPSTIGTGTVNVEGDGVGRLAVLYTWPQPEGANTAFIQLINHRRNPAAATTVTAELIVRSVNPLTSAIQRDNLFRDGPYRHSSNPRTRAITVTPLNVVSPAAIEIELEVLNEGGAGTGADYWEAAELTIVLYYQADNLFTPVYLSDPWEGHTDNDGSITGVSGQTLLHAVDVIHAIMETRLALPAQPTSFPATRATHVTYLGGIFRFDFGLGSGGWYRPQMSATELLDTLARQCSCYLFPTGDGSISIARARDAFSNELSLTADSMANVQIDLGRLELVHSTYEVRYGWSVTQQRFTKIAFATPTFCNHPDPTTASDLFERCNDSFQRYGPQQPYILEAFAIQDDATAFTELFHLVNYHWTQQVMVTCDIPFTGIHLVLGDYVQITHPELPLNDTAGLFEIVRITHRPEDGKATSWPMQVVGLRGTLTSFDYFAIKDQNNVVWYWWVNRAGEVDWSLTPPALSTRSPVDLGLSPIPSWLQVLNPAGQTRYIFPQITTGEPDVSTTQPANGTGYLGSPTVRGQGIGSYTFGVPLTREVLVIPVSATFDYFQIKDQNGLTWYWWVNRAGEFDAGLNPPSFNTFIAADLNLSPVPSWLVVLDANGATRYVYPSPLHGDPLVSATVPSVGTGRTGSPTVRSMGTGEWQWGVTAAQEPVPIAV